MGTDITVKIGGEAGQGIQTVGQLLSLCCHEAGLYVFGINDFESRIRGGNSFFQLRISDRPVRAPSRAVHLLVAIDEGTLRLYGGQVAPGGIILANREQEGQAGNVLNLPLTRLAQQAGGAIAANTVAAAAALSLLGAPLELLQAVLRRQFQHKDESTVKKNLDAAGLGYGAVRTASFRHACDWSGRGRTGVLIEGSRCLALGALGGDCRYAAFYPMSPATDIMLHLAACQSGFPLVVEQAEDEIAAVNMAIGASYAGVRSLTATSGGGFCLMTEGVGLAAMIEVPLVVINAQRPGPATGLATRTAQGDLHFVLHAAQDDFPRFVFAPGSPEEAFEITARAMELSEKYQVPAIILSDQYFNDSLFVAEPFSVPEKNDRHLCGPEPADPAGYERYAITDSGVSPRCLPCRGGRLAVANSNEHAPDGDPLESADNRTAMVDKRGRKLGGMRAEMRPPRTGHADAKNLLVGWGSTLGILQEAAGELRSRGNDFGFVHFSHIWPFGADGALMALSNAERFFVVEQNSTGQFRELLRQQTGLEAAGSILKYDGRPFFPEEVARSALEQMRGSYGDAQGF